MMKKILLFGAGKSSSYLIKYLLDNASNINCLLQIVDQQTKHIEDRFTNHKALQLFNIDVNNDAKRNELIESATLVISLLPPHLHIVVAKSCLQFSKNLITASYVSDEIKAMHQELESKKVLFMCELGLDPGIDHMSAMKIINNVEKVNAEIIEFKSHCGGLISPQDDTNPWHYKISWNPRNVVTAGKSGADFLKNEMAVRLEYENMFKNFETINVEGIGALAYYPNRDSLNYLNLYQLNDAKTLVRTTLRYPAFIKAWDYIVQMNLTNENDSYNTQELSYKQWLEAALDTKDLNLTLDKIFENDSISKSLFDFLNLGSSEIIGIGNHKSSADIMQSVIEQKWKMETDDKDMIVMQHEFIYMHKNIKTDLKSTLIVYGEDKTYTAMAKTVGLPMAIFAKLLLTDKISDLCGVQIPIQAKVYEPVLKELESEGVIFTEEIH